MTQKKMQGPSSKSMAEALYCPLGSPTCCGLASISVPRGKAEIKNSAKQARLVCCEAVLVTNESKTNVPPAQTSFPVENQSVHAHSRSLHHIKL